MIAAIRALVPFLVTLAGAAALVPSSSLALGALVVTAALVVALAWAVVAPPSRRAALVRPRRSIDLSAELAQSDPDAAGHPRSRAPGVVASAA